ncbi:MAG: DUF262 domain-containing protein [Vicinamibacterales bacterium]
MKTTATNRKVRELLTKLREGTLQPRPEFQRRLVWSNKDKLAFLDTVLRGLPFPEIYVAAGEVDVETGEAKELLVDGQQRITTLFEYFTAAPTLKLSSGIKPYVALELPEKEDFLQYDVVVRDLGKVPMEEIKEVFRRINATRYALNAMEVHNARYEGAYKAFAEQLAQHPFFERHKVFSAGEIKRMQDTRFVLVLTTTALSTYFNRDDSLEEFLSQYNDDFPLGEKVGKQFVEVFTFVDECGFPDNGRVWQTADLFTLLVELHRALFKESIAFDKESAKAALLRFYGDVEMFLRRPDHLDPQVRRYYLATLQGTNDRSSRIARGEVIRDILRNPPAMLPLS